MSPNAVAKRSSYLLQRQQQGWGWGFDTCEAPGLSSACSCLGFTSSTVTAPAATVTQTVVVNQTTVAIASLTSTFVIPTETTAITSTTLTMNTTLTSFATVTTPVTVSTTDLTTTSTATSTSTTSITTSIDTATATSTTTTTMTVVAPTGCAKFRLQLTAPAAVAGRSLQESFRLTVAPSGVVGDVFSIDTTNGNKIFGPDGNGADHDNNYHPSPFWFDTPATIAAQVAAGTWGVITCSIDTAAPGPAFPFTCSSENKFTQFLVDSAGIVYLDNSVPSGYTPATIVAYPAC